MPSQEFHRADVSCDQPATRPLRDAASIFHGPSQGLSETPKLPSENLFVPSEDDREPGGHAQRPFPMSMVSDFRWFAVRCRRGMETLVDLKLRTMLIETLLPLSKQANGEPRHPPGNLAHPLFAGYLFANFCAATSLRAVALSRGVLRVVSKNGAPVPVNEDIITSLRQRVGPDGFIELCEGSTTRRAHLHTTYHPIATWPSVFQSQLSDERRVQILIRILQESRETSDPARHMPSGSN